jgi:hypothetical protein
VTAAALLGPGWPDAGGFLRSIVADRAADSNDRRDAAHALLRFPLTAADVSVFCALILDDRTVVFWGGPAFAADALHRINDPAAEAALQTAADRWQRSRNPDRHRVLQRIVVQPKPSAIIQSHNRSDLLRYLAEIEGQDLQVRREVVLAYYAQHKSDAEQLFAQWLALPSVDECGFTPPEAELVVGILDSIEITPAMAHELPALAMRHPQYERLWESLFPYDAKLKPQAT